MATLHDEYRSPLSTRYAGLPLRQLFSEQTRIRTWRRLWIWLAKAQAELGLDIQPSQIEAMERARDDIDFEKAAAYEARFRHDVMAHVHTFGDAAPEARGVIHLGATSCFVTDNAEAVLLRDGLQQIAVSLAEAIDALGAFATTHRATACLGYTHFQPAQPTTMGKRATLWIQDLLSDLVTIERVAAEVPFRGAKGTTGTQASYLSLFEGDEEKVRTLDRKVAESAGFARSVPVTGQTYPRKADYTIVSALGGIAISATRIANDIRLLSNLRELAEPFEKEQIGSSAMAYKQNPMRSERITSLARHLMALVPEAGAMAAGQWLERTLDDSAGRRMILPEAFLCADGILRLVINVARGLHVNEGVVRARLMKELPFMATEEILMQAVRAGADRQELHERIRVHSLAAKDALLAGAEANDLLDRFRADASFAAVKDELDTMMDPSRFVGLAPRQVDRFLADEVEPVLAPYRNRLGTEVRINV